MREERFRKRLYPVSRLTESGECPVCCARIAGGCAYFSFGAVVDVLTMQRTHLADRDIEGFCHVGYHGVDPEMSDSADYCVAEGIVGGQQDICFCSLDCLRKWFSRIVDYLEQESRRGKHGAEEDSAGPVE